jgi:hypothetical protein
MMKKNGNGSKNGTKNNTENNMSGSDDDKKELKNSSRSLSH